MFIERIHVEGFGPFHDFDCQGLRPGLVLIQGPNEAGKSTLRRFVRWMLFGNQHGDRKRWTNRSGRLEGEIDLRQHGSAMSLVRRGSEVELRLDGAVHRGEVAVNNLIGGMDRALFDALFTFDLFDLQRIELIQDEHVQNLLAVGATLGGGVHPVEVLRDLAKEADAYWRPRAKDVRVRRAQQQLAQCRERLRAAREAAKAHESLVEDVEQTDRHLDALRGTCTAREKALRELKLFHAQWPAWSERSELLAELAALGPDEAVAPEVRLRIEELRRHKNESGRELHVASETLDEARSELDAIQVDDRLLSHATEVEALDERRAMLEGQIDNRQGLESELQELEAQLEQQVEELGPGWTRERALAVRIDARLEVEAQGHAERTAKLEEQVPALVADAEGALLQVRKDLAGVDQELRQVAPWPLEAREGEVQRLLSEAPEKLTRHDERRVEQERLAELRRSPPEPVEGWPELVEPQVEELVQWQAKWTSESRRHRDMVTDAKERLEDTKLDLESARQTMEQAEALPGADAPSRQAIAALKAQWPSVCDDVMNARELTREHEKLMVDLSRLPATLGGDVTLEQLAAVDRSAQARSELMHAHRAVADAEAARNRARAALDALGTPSGSTTYSAEAEAEAVDLRRRLLEARSALEAYQQILGQAAPGEEAASSSRLRWAGPALLVGFAVLGLVLSQALLAAVAMTAAVLLAVVTWRTGRGGSEVAAVSSPAARQAFLDAVGRAGLSGEPTRGAIDEQLEEVRARIAHQQRAKEDAKHAEDALKRRERVTGELETAESEQKTRHAELISRLEDASLPKTLDHALTVAWLDAAVELAALRRRRGEIQRERDQAKERIDGFSEGFAALTTVRSSEPRRVEAALASLEARRAEADTREEAVNEHKARVREAEKAVTRAKQHLDTLAAQDEVPSDVTASYSVWLKSHGIPDGPPTSEMLDDARRMQRTTAWRRDVAGREARVQELDATLVPLEEALRELGEILSIPTGAGVAALVEGLREAWQRESKRSATRSELEKRRARIVEKLSQAEQAQRDGQGRQQELKEAREDYLAWARRAAAPPDLPPASAEKWVERLGRIQAVEKRREAQRRELDTLVRTVESLLDAALGLASALQEPPVARRFDSVATSVRRWRQLLDEARSAQARRGDHEERIRVLHERLQRKERVHEQNVRLWQKEIEEFGCADESMWSARLDRDTARGELLARKGKIEARLKGALGTRWDDASSWARSDVHDSLQYEARTEALEQELATLADKIEEHTRERGEMAARVRDLERNADVVERSQELASAQAELERDKREWWRLQIAIFLLEDTFQRFRRERQPAVLRRASKWFCRATEGAYQGLEVEEEASSGPNFQVKARDGSRHPAEGLSTGTTGLLYLCLRLALALDQAGQIAAVPMLLDDVLAHFDPERSRAAARLIHEVARDEAGLQLLMFTCRPETEQTLLEVDESLHVIRLHRWAGADQPPGRHGGATTRRATTSTLKPGRAPKLDASDVEDFLSRALDLLGSRGEALARSDFVTALGLDDHQWKTLRSLLVASERIEETGSGKGKRYELLT